MRRLARAAVLATATALVLAACAAGPEDEPEETASPGDGPEVAVGYKGCLVSDAGGFDDRSFNQAGLEGLMRAQDELGIETAQAESTAGTDFAPNIDAMVDQDCDLVITVGFPMADATGATAAANPDLDFATIDDQSIDADNVKPILFNTAEAAFLAGYLAAGYSTTGTVATFGGVPIPPMTIYMDGFVDGVAHYNEVKGTDVQVLGWDKASQQGEFVGDFDDIVAGQDLTRSFIDAGADVILPVAGPVGSGAAAAALEAGNVAFIGVEQDWYVAAPEYADVTLTSIVKQIAPAVFDVLTQADDGTFSKDPYVGTLENGGVALAPFHDFDGAISDELKREIDQLKVDIIAGDIVVESVSIP